MNHPCRSMLIFFSRACPSLWFVILYLIMLSIVLDGKEVKLTDLKFLEFSAELPLKNNWCHVAHRLKKLKFFFLLKKLAM